MSNSIQDRITKIVDSFYIHSQFSFSINGNKPVQLPNNTGTTPAEQIGHYLPRDPLTRELQSLFYRKYCSADNSVESGNDQIDPSIFASQLSAANKSIEGWDHGWNVYQTTANGSLSIQKGDRHRTVYPGEYVTSGPPGTMVKVGTVVSVRVVRESFEIQQGFYYVFGHTLSDQFDDHNLVRFYFNATPEGALKIVHELTTALNRFQVPFRFKTLSFPSSYNRTDAAVLYIARRYFHIVAMSLQEVYERTLRLKSEIPLFTKKILPGIGIAEDPGTTESFGMHRCRLLAEGIVEAWKNGNQQLSAKMEAIKKQFTSNGLDIEKPYLNKNSVDFLLPDITRGVEI
ncbi:MAG: T3SS effector HopA1 family protein [Candidatus Electrothrix aestuarii]|uniref:T3SS effector HopA1 family protein n=1 Tax=Candidatus Electrothrix aestuarii TaxID=3062594 RepID=A0AAU8LQL1_9BACT|nr:T3SS effector HopA1 family protein [Candidatus Electrothrix aestuarii]